MDSYLFPVVLPIHGLRQLLIHLIVFLCALGQRGMKLLDLRLHLLLTLSNKLMSVLLVARITPCTGTRNDTFKDSSIIQLSLRLINKDMHSIQSLNHLLLQYLSECLIMLLHFGALIGHQAQLHAHALQLLLQLIQQTVLLLDLSDQTRLFRRISDGNKKKISNKPYTLNQNLKYIDCIATYFVGEQFFALSQRLSDLSCQLQRFFLVFQLFDRFFKSRLQVLGLVFHLFWTQRVGTTPRRLGKFACQN